MRIQTQPTRWSCAATAFAMALDVPVAELIESIGHDGSEIIWPDLPDPMCRRGFHSQELIDECLKRGHGCTPVEWNPSTAPSEGEGRYEIFDTDQAAERVIRSLEYPNSVMECEGHRWRHCVHHHDGRIYDPCGQQYDLSELIARGLQPYRIWIIT
jgi:hypothetical protein